MRWCNFNCKASFAFFAVISQIGFSQTDTAAYKGTPVKDSISGVIQVDQVVVTGQFRPQPTDRSIYSINVIDNRQFQLKAANNLGDLLRTEPGFQYRSEGVLGDFVRIRGLSGEYVKILIDGVPVTGRVADRIDLGQITLNNVDHIEIVEGPMSVIYGSNALAGAINIITKDNSKNYLNTSADAYYESIGTFNLNGAMSLSRNRHSFSVTMSRNFFAGWGSVDTSRYKAWKPKRQYLTGIGYQYSIHGLQLKVNSDFLHEELHDPDSLSLNNLYEKPLDGYHFTTRWNNRISVVNTFRTGFALNLQMGYSYYRKKKITYLNDLVMLRKSISQNPDLHDTTNFHLLSARGFVSSAPGRKIEYQTGVDVNMESADGKRTGGLKQINDMAGFVSFFYNPLKSISFQPGIRIIYNSNYRAPLVYSINFKYQLASFTMRASYAKGFRAPSLKQLYLQFIDNNHEIYGNPHLKAETAHNLSLNFNYSRLLNRHAVDAGLGIFYNSIQHAIQLAISTDRPGWGMYFNVEGMQYITQGAEINLQYRFSPGFTLTGGAVTTGRLRLNSSGAYSWSTDFASSISYRYPKRNLQAALFFKHNGDYLEFAGNYNSAGQLQGVTQQGMDGYNTLDIILSGDVVKHRFNLSAGVKNLFNITLVNSFGSFAVHGSSKDLALAGYGRTVFIKLGFRFEKAKGV